jgi:hypothetical protein
MRILRSLVSKIVGIGGSRSVGILMTRNGKTMITNTREEPLYSRLYEDGSNMCEVGESSLCLNWIHGKQGSLEQKRLSIYIDLPETVDKLPEIYFTRVGPGTYNDLGNIKTSRQLKAILDEYFSVKVKE